jgi:hypothetical protein
VLHLLEVFGNGSVPDRALSDTEALMVAVIGMAALWADSVVTRVPGLIFAAVVVVFASVATPTELPHRGQSRRGPRHQTEAERHGDSHPATVKGGAVSRVVAPGEIYGRQTGPGDRSCQDPTKSICNPDSIHFEHLIGLIRLLAQSRVQQKYGCETPVARTRVAGPHQNSVLIVSDTSGDVEGPKDAVHVLCWLAGIP